MTTIKTTHCMCCSAKAWPDGAMWEKRVRCQGCGKMVCQNCIRSIAAGHRSGRPSGDYCRDCLRPRLNGH